MNKRHACLIDSFDHEKELCEFYLPLVNLPIPKYTQNFSKYNKIMV